MEIEEFKACLQEYLKQTINLVVTNNRRIVLFFSKDKNNEIKVKINRIFLNSTSEVIKSIAEFISRHSKKSKFEIRKFIALNQEEINRFKPRRKTKISLIHQGNYFSIKELFDKINDRYFSNEINSHISWGKYPRKIKRKKSIRYGAFIPEKNLIIINRRLDNNFIPEFFLNYILYHEMLHAYFYKSKNDNKSQLSFKQMQIEFNSIKSEKTKPRIIHNREFKIKEREFEDYEKAKKWEKDNLRKILKI